MMFAISKAVKKMVTEPLRDHHAIIENGTTT